MTAATSAARPMVASARGQDHAPGASWLMAAHADRSNRADKLVPGARASSSALRAGPRFSHSGIQEQEVITRGRLRCRRRSGRKTRVSESADLLSQPDENPLGASDVAKPIHVFVIDYFVDELSAVLLQAGERVVEIVDGEHDSQIAQSVHWGVAVIGDHGWREKSREFDPAVAVGHPHHGDLDALVAQSSDAT